MKASTVVRYSTILTAWLLILSVATLIVNLADLVVWRFVSPSTKTFAAALRVPVERKVDDNGPYIPIQGELTQGEGKPSTLPGSWSNFRGDRFDAIYREPIKLEQAFPEDGPPKCWQLQLGEGFAGPAIRNGRVYLLDYDMETFRDALRCLSLEDGREIWRFSYPVRIKKNHGMSRTIPAVTDRYCVSLGPKCHVLCVNAITGEEQWFVDMKHVYGTTEPEWYAGQCPLIVDLNDKEAAIIAPAGPEVLLTAIDCESGKEIWRTPNPFNWTMTHVSVMPMTLDDGRETYIYCGKGGVVGVDAKDGKILWSTTDWQIEIATCPSPVPLPDNRIFCCGGYLSGSVMLQISTDPTSEGGYRSTTLYRLKDAIFGSEQQTPIFFDNHLFGVRQRDKEFVCLSLDGKVVWHSGSKGRFGGGPYLLVDNGETPIFLILDDNAKLTACEATTAGYRVQFSAEILDNHGAWAPMAMVAGRLLLRDQINMACLDLRAIAE